MKKNGEFRQCGVCGESFYRTRQEIDTKPSLWCSHPCADIGRRKGSTLTCKECGKSFYKYPSMMTANPKWNTGQFCSMACYGIHKPEILKGIPKSEQMRANLSKSKTGIPIPSRQKPDFVLECLGCGSVYTLPGRTTYAAKTHKFCTLECAYQYRREHPEKHPNWRGGGYDFFGPNWSMQRAAALRRDSDTCQHCGLHQTKPRLDVHHIRPRRLFGTDYAAANDLSNLVTLCRSCHMAAEHSALSLAS